MTILYRILSLVINIGGLLLAISLIFFLPSSMLSPMMWLPTFIFAAIVLYTWFSYQFRRKVLVRKEIVKRSLYDWVRVNGIVALIFCMLEIPGMFALLRNPHIVMDVMKQFSAQYGQSVEKYAKPEILVAFGSVMLVYLIGLLVHIIWTFGLMKKNKENFK